MTRPDLRRRALVLGGLVSALPVAARSGTMAGTVAAVSGRCTVHGTPLKPGDGVPSGDTVVVPPDGNLKLQMADQSVILIAAGSSVTLSRYEAGPDRAVRLALAHGLLRLQVPAASGASSFEVTTETSTAAMRSGAADWFVAVQGGAAQLGVLSGTVVLTSSGTGRSVSVPARWGSRLEPGLSPTLPRAWAQVEFDAFIRRTACCQSPAAEAKP